MEPRNSKSDQGVEFRHIFVVSGYVHQSATELCFPVFGQIVNQGNLSRALDCSPLLGSSIGVCTVVMRSDVVGTLVLTGRKGVDLLWTKTSDGSGKRLYFFCVFG
jgi:hypothetical protein